MGLWFVANSRKILENLKKSRKFGISNLKTAATGQPLVRNWWNFRWKKFRPKPWLQAKNHTNRSNRAEMRGRKVPNMSGRLEVSEMHFPTFLDIFEKFRPREIFWHQLVQDRLRIDGKILVWKKSMKNSDLPLRSCCGPVFANVVPKNCQQNFLPKNYLWCDSWDSRGVHTGRKMVQKRSGFSPFLTPCAQGGGPWGPWGGFFQVPPGPHQITPQGHWSGSY